MTQGDFLRFLDYFSVGLLIAVPIGLVIWGVYVLRSWRGLWRVAAALAAFVIVGDVALLAIAGGYAGGMIVGLHLITTLLAVMISAVHRLRTRPS